MPARAPGGPVTSPPEAAARGAVVRLSAGAAAALELPETVFLPLEVVQRCAITSATLELGGAPPLTLGVCVVEGRVLTLVAIGARTGRGPVVICAREGAEPIALGVEEVVATGLFPVAPGGVVGPAGEAPSLDVPALLARLEPDVWGSGPPEGPRSEPRSAAS